MDKVIGSEDGAELPPQPGEHIIDYVHRVNAESQARLKQAWADYYRQLAAQRAQNTEGAKGDE